MIWLCLCSYSTCQKGETNVLHGSFKLQRKWMLQIYVFVFVFQDRKQQVRPWVLSTKCLNPLFRWVHFSFSANTRWWFAPGFSQLTVSEQQTVTFFFFCVFLCVRFFFNTYSVVSTESKSLLKLRVKLQGHLNLLYPHFHGSSSTREKSAALPFLPMVTCKQLSRTTNYWGQGTIIVVGSREAIAWFTFRPLTLWAYG